MMFCRLLSKQEWRKLGVECPWKMLPKKLFIVLYIIIFGVFQMRNKIHDCLVPFINFDGASHIEPRRLRCWGFYVTLLDTHTCTHPVGLLWTSDQPVPEAATYTKHNKPMRRIFMPALGFEPEIPAIMLMQTYALDHTATGIGFFLY